MLEVHGLIRNRVTSDSSPVNFLDEPTAHSLSSISKKTKRSGDMAHNQNNPSTNTGAREQVDPSAQASPYKSNLFNDCELPREIHDFIARDDREMRMDGFLYEDTVSSFVKKDLLYLPSSDLEAHHIHYGNLFDWIIYGGTPLYYTQTEDSKLSVPFYAEFRSKSGSASSYPIFHIGNLRVFFQRVAKLFGHHQDCMIHFSNNTSPFRDGPFLALEERDF